MSIKLETRTVFRCKCGHCGWEWDAFKKPKRCAKCKYTSWNGEDHRFQNPYASKGQTASPWTRKAISPESRIETGREVPRLPRWQAILDIFTEARGVIDQLIYDNSPCNHAKNQCICAETKLLAKIDRQIVKLKSFLDPPRPEPEPVLKPPQPVGDRRERNAVILREFKDGITPQQIGERYDLSRQRVYQIVRALQEA